MKKIMGLFALIHLVLFAPGLAKDGGGSIGGGGSSLTEVFEQSYRGSLYLLNDFPAEGLDAGVCSAASRAWILKSLPAISHSLQNHPLKWGDYAMESQALRTGRQSQRHCAVISNGAIQLSVTLCKPLVLQRQDALREMYYALFSDGPFGYSRNQSRGVVECLSSVLDAHFWNYVWAGNNVRSASNDVSRQIGRMVRYSDVEAQERLRDFLEEGRRTAVGILKALDKAHLPSTLDQTVVRWLFDSSDGREENRLLLAKDIERTPYTFTWDAGAQASCATTRFHALSSVQFSLPLCKKNIETELDALQTVVHESTHHAPFSIRDELRADQIGTAVAQIVKSNPSSVYRSREEQQKEMRKVRRLVDEAFEELDRIGKRRNQ